MNLYIVLRAVLIILIVTAVTVVIKKGSKKESEYADDKIIVIKFTRLIFDIGIAVSLIFGALTALSLMNMDEGIFSVIIFGLFFLLGLFMAVSAVNWKIEFRKQDEHFKYTTVFGRKYDIKCREVTYLKISSDNIVFKAKGKRFVATWGYYEFEKFIKRTVPAEITQASRPTKEKKKGPIGRALDALESPIEFFMSIFVGVMGLGIAGVALYDICTNVELVGTNRMFACLIAAVGIICMGFPILFVYGVNNREKHPWLIKSLLKDGYLKEDNMPKKKKKKRKKK